MKEVILKTPKYSFEDKFSDRFSVTVLNSTTGHQNDKIYRESTER